MLGDGVADSSWSGRLLPAFGEQLLVGRRREFLAGRVPPAGVVALDPGRDRGPGLRPGGEVLQRPQLELQGGVPRFDDRVIESGPGTAHGLGDGKPLAGLPEGPGGVLGCPARALRCPARALGQQVAGTATRLNKISEVSHGRPELGGTQPAAIARQRRTDVASAALASPSLAASVHNCAVGSAASVARSAATGSSIRVAVTAAIARHHRGADMSR